MTDATSMQDSSVTNQTLAALKHAQESLLSENIRVTSASVSNPGIPPSSLMTFLNKVRDSAIFSLPIMTLLLKELTREHSYAY